MTKDEITQVFSWKNKDGTEFRYAIDLAKIVIAERGIKPLNIITPELAQEALRLNQDAPELDAKFVESADLNEPLIIVVLNTPEGERHIIIDGWHRVTKAVKNNHPDNLHAYIIEAEDAEYIRLFTEEVLSQIGDIERFRI